MLSPWVVFLPIEQAEVEKILDVWMEDFADTIFTLSQQNLVKNKSTDSGQLLNTGNVNRAFLSKEVVYPAPHAVWVEYGTQPHPVSKKGILALQNWAKRKLGLNEKQAKNAAWGIANKIRMKGMRPKPFLRPALDEAIFRKSIA